MPFYTLLFFEQTNIDKGAPDLILHESGSGIIGEKGAWSMKQESFSDMEYAYREKKTKREEFLEIMDEIIPWEEWVPLVVPHSPSGKRGRPPIEIETMLMLIQPVRRRGRRRHI